MRGEILSTQHNHPANLAVASACDTTIVSELLHTTSNHSQRVAKGVYVQHRDFRKSHETTPTNMRQTDAVSHPNNQPEKNSLQPTQAAKRPPNQTANQPANRDPTVTTEGRSPPKT